MSGSEENSGFRPRRSRHHDQRAKFSRSICSSSKVKSRNEKNSKIQDGFLSRAQTVEA